MGTKELTEHTLLQLFLRAEAVPVGGAFCALATWCTGGLQKGIIDKLNLQDKANAHAVEPHIIHDAAHSEALWF